MHAEEVSLHAIIESVGAYVPERVVTNAELASKVDTTDEWIFGHTGISERRIAADSEKASDLATIAAERALERSGVSADSIDLILLATSTPDFAGFPSTSCIVQENIGASRAGAMDLFAACTGFIYGLDTARAFIESGSASRVLVIGTEVFSRIVDWTDRSTCVLFGDGAGAAVISASDSAVSRIETGILRSQGSGADYLFYDTAVRMKGRQVYNFAVKALCDTITELLEKGDLQSDDVHYIVPHQANVRIISAAANRLGLPGELFYTNMVRYANTSAASIPIALNEMFEAGLLERGNLLVTVGFGGGLTYGGNIIYW